jgi:hypothetical protein
MSGTRTDPIIIEDGLAPAVTPTRGPTGAPAGPSAVGPAGATAGATAGAPAGAPAGALPPGALATAPRPASSAGPSESEQNPVIIDDD